MRPWQDSNLQSSDSKSDALSIRPQGRWKFQIAKRIFKPGLKIGYAVMVVMLSQTRWHYSKIYITKWWHTTCTVFGLWKCMCEAWHVCLLWFTTTKAASSNICMSTWKIIFQKNILFPKTKCYYMHDIEVLTVAYCILFVKICRIFAVFAHYFIKDATPWQTQ